MGEKPSIRLAAANAAETSSGSVISFDLVSGQGAKVKPGDYLASSGSSTAEDSLVYHVVSVSTDTITGVPILGSVGVPTETIDNRIFEQNPPVTELEIIRNIRAIVAVLWPKVFKFVSATVTPSFTSPVAVPSEARDIIHAEQRIGGIPYSVGYRLYRNRHTTLSATGVLADFAIADGSTVYYTYTAEEDEDTTDPTVQRLVALGAAGMCLTGVSPAAAMERSKQDNEFRPTGLSAAISNIWREFALLREQISEDLSRDVMGLRSMQ
jgi:hypothetical protein